MTEKKQPPEKPRAKGARGSADSVTLAERYAYELAKRSNWRGIGDAALAGDREAIKDLAAIGTVFMDALATSGKAEANSETAEAAFWLASILSDIHAGQEPNIAFGYVKPGEEGAHEKFRTIRRRWIIGRDVAGHMARGTVDAEDVIILTKARFLVKSGNRMTLDFAAVLAAARHGCSAQYARDNYAAFVKRDNSEL